MLKISCLGKSRCLEPVILHELYTKQGLVWLMVSMELSEIQAFI